MCFISSLSTLATVALNNVSVTSKANQKLSSVLSSSASVYVEYFHLRFIREIIKSKLFLRFYSLDLECGALNYIYDVKDLIFSFIDRRSVKVY